MISTVNLITICYIVILSPFLSFRLIYFKASLYVSQTFQNLAKLNNSSSYPFLTKLLLSKSFYFSVNAVIYNPYVQGSYLGIILDTFLSLKLHI